MVVIYVNPPMEEEDSSSPPGWGIPRYNMFVRAGTTPELSLYLPGLQDCILGGEDRSKTSPFCWKKSKLFYLYSIKIAKDNLTTEVWLVFVGFSQDFISITPRMSAKWSVYPSKAITPLSQHRSRKAVSTVIGAPLPPWKGSEKQLFANSSWRFLDMNVCLVSFFVQVFLLLPSWIRTVVVAKSSNVRDI